MPKPELIGLGVDLLSLSRAKRLVAQTSEERLRHWLDSDASTLSASRSLTPRIFARLFTAKEAFSKALGISLLSPADLARFKVKLLPRKRFEVEFTESGRETATANGCYFEAGDYVGAHVAVWK